MKTCQSTGCENITNNPKFCSLSCSVRSQDHSHFKKEPVSDVCQNPSCGRTFERKVRSTPRKFCSSSCSAKVANAGRRRHGNAPVEVVCERCGEVFMGKRDRVFCSSSCFAKGPSDPTSSKSKRKSIEKWLSGAWDGTVKSGLSSTVRRYLIEEAGFRCSNDACSTPGGFAEVNPATGKVPLEIDHLDGNCFNNKPENLVVLCPNCHALTPTYRALNRGNGRAYRGKYDQFARVDKSTEQVVD